MTRIARAGLMATLLALTTTGVDLGALATAANAASAITAQVETDGGALNVRSGPSAASTRVGSLADGASFSVSCQVTGQYVTGHVRDTAQWDRLAGGNYVSDGYVRAAAQIPSCSAATAPAPLPAPTSSDGPTPGMSNAQFIAASVAPAQVSQREFGVPASVTIAQAILESGWGRSGLAANDRNFFGIKCFSATPGPIHIGCHSYSTTECEPTCQPTTASFRVYASATDSFRDHGRFLTTNSRYQPAFAYTYDPDQFIYQVWKAGYATSPTYAANVTNLMREYNLYQYDNPGGPVVTLQAQVNGRYVTAERAGASPLIANRATAGLWESFDEIDLGNGNVALRAHVNGHYVTAESAGRSPLVANRTTVGSWETFQLIHNPDGTVSFQAQANGRYVTAEAAGHGPLVANRTAIGQWEEFSQTS
jgi:flagellum-specific peptidoglycan hydrolase FlgJ